MQPAYWVRGTLRNLAMRQAAKVEFLNEAGEVTAIRVMVNSATGRFEARDVVPGTNLLRASQGKGETEIRGEQQVQVGSADVDGVALELLPGVTVTGVVRDERKRGRCSMTLESTHESVAAASPFQANPGDDGTFAIHNVPAGKYRVRVRTYGAYVASLMSGAQDLSNGAELVVSPGTAPEPLEIVVRTDVGSVLGVIDPSAKVADRVWILLLPTADGEPERTLSFGGKFSFLSLAPGDYQAYLFKELDNIEFRNPDVLRGLKSESVHVTAGGSTTVTLKAVAQ
jgi:hypothetical protein